MEVAEASMTKKSPTLFGLVNIFDDPLIEGPEPTSKLVGRVQGLYGPAGQQEVGLLLAGYLVFTTGKFNGSSLTILGRNAMFHPIRVMPIIGGACAFRLARGFVQPKTHFFQSFLRVHYYRSKKMYSHSMVLHNSIPRGTIEKNVSLVAQIHVSIRKHQSHQ